MLPLIAAVGSYLGGKLIERGIDRGVDAISGDDKVPGVPTPDQGGPQGRNYSNFLDAAFPGTTPWERLGANTPAGAVDSASITAKSQQQMQSRELDNRREIADMNNRAALISAGSPMGANVSESNLMAYYTGRGSTYDSHNVQEREALDSRIKRQSAEGRLAGAKAYGERGRSKYAEDKAKAELATEKVRPMVMAADSASNVVSSINPFGMGLRELSAFVKNVGKRPRRFGFAHDQS